MGRLLSRVLRWSPAWLSNATFGWEARWEADGLPVKFVGSQPESRPSCVCTRAWQAQSGRQLFGVFGVQASTTHAVSHVTSEKSPPLMVLLWFNFIAVRHSAMRFPLWLVWVLFRFCVTQEKIVNNDKGAVIFNAFPIPSLPSSHSHLPDFSEPAEGREGHPGWAPLCQPRDTEGSQWPGPRLGAGSPEVRVGVHEATGPCAFVAQGSELLS